MVPVAALYLRTPADVGRDTVPVAALPVAAADFLLAPVAVADLEEVLDRALEDMMNRKPKIDIRANDRTVTVLEEEFLYAEQLKDVMAVHLINNVTVMSSEILKNFAARMTGFPDLCSISDDVLVHRQAVAEISFGKVVLKDGRKFKANPKRIKDLKK